MTVRGDKYDAYKEALLAGGAPAAEVERAITLLKATDACVDALACEVCRSKLIRTLDPRQAGPTRVAGKWFNYRCTSCEWFVDRCEPVGEN
jgi:hypothetical protein